MVIIVLETIAVGIAGGIIFNLVNVPLAWMLGSMTGVSLWNILAKRQVFFPVSVRNAALIYIGYTMGRTFTMETLQKIISLFPSMFAVTVLTILFSLLLGYITARKTGISLATGLLGSVPGGLTQMIVLCEEFKDTDLTMVIFMQTARIIAVVCIVPFLAVHGFGDEIQISLAHTLENVSFFEHHELALYHALACLIGAIIAFVIKFPTPFMLGPVFGTAALVLSGMPAPVLPKGFIIVAQLCMGLYMGTNLNVDNLPSLKTIMPYVIMGAVGVVLFSLGAGWGLALIHDFSAVSAFLGTAPGGIAEMSLTALSIGADLSVVLAYQLFRLIFILIGVPYFLRWMIAVMNQKCN